MPKQAKLQLSTPTGLLNFNAEPPSVRVHSKIDVKITDAATLQEAVAQLGRPIKTGTFRVIALQPGAPVSLPAVLARNKTAASVESLDPLRLTEAIGLLRGQTVLITGRLEGKLLFVQGAGGDRGVIVADVINAAHHRDVNLILVETLSGRQPGERNWLWQRAEIRGVEGLPSGSTMGRLLESLIGEDRVLTIVPLSTSATRVFLEAGVSGDPQSNAGLGGRLARVATDVSNTVTGKIEPVTIRLYLVSQNRQRELDWRLIPWLPSWIAFGYLLLIGIGAAGVRPAWRWWSTIWPPESQADYHGTVGLHLAQAVRLLIFIFAFMPFAALLAAPASLANRILRR